MNKNLKIYLVGAMEAAEDQGMGWRNAITPFLESLDLEVLNPCEFEPQQLKGLQPNRLPEFYTDLHGNKIKPKFWYDLKNAKEPHLYARFKKYMQRIIRYDCSIVNNVADYIICYWDEATGKGAGTHAELTLGYLKNIPIYCVTTTDMPAWAKGCVTQIFLNFESLKEFLLEEFDHDNT